jgi:hypothetical protein
LVAGKDVVPKMGSKDILSSSRTSAIVLSNCSISRIRFTQKMLGDIVLTEDGE